MHVKSTQRITAHLRWAFALLIVMVGMLWGVCARGIDYTGTLNRTRASHCHATRVGDADGGGRKASSANAADHDDPDDGVGGLTAQVALTSRAFLFLGRRSKLHPSSPTPRYLPASGRRVYRLAPKQSPPRSRMRS